MLCLGVQGTCKSLPNSEISIRTRHCLNSQTKCNTRLQAPLSLANCLGPFRRSSTAGLQPDWKTHGQYLHLDVQGPPSPKFMSENWPLSLEDAEEKVESWQGITMGRGPTVHWKPVPQGVLARLHPRRIDPSKNAVKLVKNMGQDQLGLAANLADVYRFLAFARSSIDQTAGEV